MNELEINYNKSKFQKMLLLVAGGYFTLFGIYLCVMQALAGVYALDFYLALAGAILGVVLVLDVTLWESKPIFKMDQESVYVNMPGQKNIYMVDWLSVKEVGIGLSYLKFSETDGKDYTVDISGLKYNDLKNVKSGVVEICESKNIPYRND